MIASPSSPLARLAMPLLWSKCSIWRGSGRQVFQRHRFAPCSRRTIRSVIWSICSETLPERSIPRTSDPLPTDFGASPTNVSLDPIGSRQCLGARPRLQSRNRRNSLKVSSILACGGERLPRRYFRGRIRQPLT